MLIAQCNGNEIITPSALRLVPYKPRFHYASLFTTGYDLQGKSKLDLWYKGSASTIAQPKEEEDRAFVVPGSYQ